MRAFILIAAAALSFPLAACETMGTTQSPAPLQQTAIDDRGVRIAFLSLDAVATLVDQAIDAKLIVPGSPKALTIANALTRAKAAVNAASHAQKAGSVATYQQAMDEATAAIAQAKTALGK
jgi:hypothetical protein